MRLPLTPIKGLTVALLLLLFTAPVVSGVERRVGVEVGDTYTYRYQVFIESNDPELRLPALVAAVNGSNIIFLVAKIEGKRVFYHETIIYINGSRRNVTLYTDVESGEASGETGFLSWQLISPGLMPGDAIYEGGPYANQLVNKTIDYGGREAVYMNTRFQEEVPGTPPAQVYAEGEFVWDRELGVLIKAAGNVTRSRDGFTTRTAFLLELINISKTTEIPPVVVSTSPLPFGLDLTTFAAIIAVVVAGVGTLVVLRRRKPRE
jgi:hypothetical protein